MRRGRSGRGRGAREEYHIMRLESVGGVLSLARVGLLPDGREASCLWQPVRHCRARDCWVAASVIAGPMDAV